MVSIHVPVFVNTQQYSKGMSIVLYRLNFCITCTLKVGRTDANL